MSFALKIVRLEFNILSSVSPKLAAKKAFNVFQKVRKKDIREREEVFYKEAQEFKVKAQLTPEKEETIFYYKLGEATGKPVFLIHGWDSNPGSLYQLAKSLEEAGHHLVLINLPGHGKSPSSSTNILECQRALKAVLEHENPAEPFSMISHSFGSAVTAYALAETGKKVEKLIFLTNPNKVERIFNEFKETIGLSDKAYREMIRLTEKRLEDSVSIMTVQNNLHRANYDKLLMIHDRYDRVLPYINSEEIKQEHPQAELRTYEKIGHYKMLWNKEVIADCVQFLQEN